MVNIILGWGERPIKTVDKTTFHRGLSWCAYKVARGIYIYIELVCWAILYTSRMLYACYIYCLVVSSMMSIHLQHDTIWKPIRLSCGSRMGMSVAILKPDPYVSLWFLAQQSFRIPSWSSCFQCDNLPPVVSLNLLIWCAYGNFLTTYGPMGSCLIRSSV